MHWPKWLVNVRNSGCLCLFGRMLDCKVKVIPTDRGKDLCEDIADLHNTINNRDVGGQAISIREESIKWSRKLLPLKSTGRYCAVVF
jgi:hypothetical protein